MRRINLLPGSMREDFTYARHNTRLIKWCIAMLAGIAGIIAVVVIGLAYINQQTGQLEKRVAQAQAELDEQDLKGVQARVEEMSDSFNLVVQVLSRQVLFSRLLEQAGAVMPAGSVLANLTIDELTGGIDLQVLATNYQSATQVPVNLQDPANQIFERVDILDIACGEGEPNYLCGGSYRALFAEENQFMFIQPNGGNR